MKMDKINRNANRKVLGMKRSLISFKCKLSF